MGSRADSLHHSVGLQTDAIRDQNALNLVTSRPSAACAVPRSVTWVADPTDHHLTSPSAGTLAASPRPHHGVPATPGHRDDAIQVPARLATPGV